MITKAKESMNKFTGKYCNDFLEGSTTIYNYVPFTRYPYLFYAQLAGIQNIGPKYFNDSEFSQEFLINYTLEGEGSFTIFNEEHILKKGDLIFINNFYRRLFKPIEGSSWKFACLHIFPNETLSLLYQKILEKQRWLLHDVDENSVVPYIKRIIKLLSMGVSKNEIPISSCIYELLLSIYSLAIPVDSTAIDNELSSVVSYIRENYSSPITLSDILKNTSYSKNHLERLFKDRMKMTINDYLTDLRLKKSQSLILSTDTPFKEVANQVGLPDYRALVYMYKKMFNMSPGEYKEHGKTAIKPTLVDTFVPNKTIV
jgi:AraC-like DNA-binding protein